MNMLTKYPKKSLDAASRVIDNEAVIVIPQEGLVRVLNDTGTRIWQLLDGKKTTGNIINIISSEFQVSQEQAENDILDFIKELEKKGMVTISDESI